MRCAFVRRKRPLYPHNVCTKLEIEEILTFSIEGRRRVKEQLLKLDETFSPVTFSYLDKESGKQTIVITAEERQYPALARKEAGVPASDNDELSLNLGDTTETTASPITPQAGHIVVPENSKGYGDRRLFAEHLRGAHEIKVLDPYIRAFWQIRNFMEFVQMVHELTPEGEETRIHLITKTDPDRHEEQDGNLRRIQDSCVGTRVSIEYEYDEGGADHARSISTDTGWKISLDRGLDIYQRYEINDFNLVAAVQSERLTKAFEVTYIRM